MQNQPPGGVNSAGAPPAATTQVAPAGTTQVLAAGSTQVLPAGTRQVLPAGTRQVLPAGTTQVLAAGTMQALPSDKDAYMRRWDDMHFVLALVVILLAGFLIGIFAIRGDTQGMSTAAGIVSAWVGAVLGWYFTTKSASSQPPASPPGPPGPPGAGGPPGPPGPPGAGGPPELPAAAGAKQNQ
jgi:hypothetical protein